MIMVSSPNLIVIFLGLEVLSVSSYALAGLKRNDEQILGSRDQIFPDGKLCQRLPRLRPGPPFRHAHALDISGLIAFFAPVMAHPALGLAGLGLVLIGFAFKIALVPFHMWTPDVYEGAPTPVTAFFAVGPKAAGFAVLLQALRPLLEQRVSSRSLFWLLWGHGRPDHARRKPDRPPPKEH